jgi:hypothetical protein
MILTSTPVLDIDSGDHTDNGGAVMEKRPLAPGTRPGAAWSQYTVGGCRPQFAAVLVIVLASVSPFTPLNRAFAQRSQIPRDGQFYVEARPAFVFQAILAEDWVCPHAGRGTLHVYAPVLPELPGQGRVSTRLFVAMNDKLKAEAVTELSESKRPMLALRIPSDQLSPKERIRLRIAYEGILFARTLRRGRPRKNVPDLAPDERQRYLMASATMDYGDAGFVRWMNDQGLKRQKDEQAMAFGYRVFTHFIKNGKYGGDTSNYEARRPSRVCKSFASDCGGLALLFTAVMRANDVPARTLSGRWAIPQTDDYGQHHGMAEFFVAKSGWVPVDISGTLVHKPANPYAFFGNTDGQHLAFHVDTDLEPAKGFHHAWAQYPLLQWTGTGDFWKEHRVDSKWDVSRQPLAR